MAAIGAAALALLPACRGERAEAPVADSWQTGSYTITAGGISFPGGDALLAASDSSATLRRGGADVCEINLGPLPPGTPRFESEDTLLSFLYHLEATTDTVGAQGRPYLPYTIYINPLPADRSAALLAARLRNDLPLPPELARYSWPVVRDNAQWLMAAAETAVAGGDERWTRRVMSAARQLLQLDTRMALNRQTGLFQGTPRYLLSPASRFPAWMGPVDIFQNQTLSENAAYHAALSNLERIAADGGADLRTAYQASSLCDAINSHLWNPSSGTYGATLYGNPLFPVRLRSADNAAQAIAILGGTASEAMAASIAARTPTGPFGIRLLDPGWGGDSVSATEFPPILSQTLWMAAMSATANETAYSAAVAALIAARTRALFDSRLDSAPHAELGAVRPIAALVLRGFLGARFSPEGMYLSPAVPAGLPGDKRVTGLRYRDALLNISITGTGRALATFSLDGKPASPFVPADLAGEHDIEITLAGTASDPGSITLADGPARLAPPPPVTWPRPLEARIGPDRDAAARPSDNGFAIFLNGTLDQVTAAADYVVAAPRCLTSIQFAAVTDDGLPGFTSQPKLLIPRGWETIERVTDHAAPGTRLIGDRKAAAGVAESNRWKNRDISFSYDAPADGLYIVDARYSGGLGIVNPRRRTALRRLKVNGVEAGIFVFPQFSPAWWNRDTGTGWQLPTTYSNQLCVELRKGENELSLVYFQPSPVYIDPLANTILLDQIRIRRVE